MLRLASCARWVALALGLLAILPVAQGEDHPASSVSPRPPCILIRSGWQTVNIGDIAHTPGLLSLLHDYLPGAKLIVWGVDLRDGVEEMLRAQFPDAIFVHGDIGPDNKPSTPELAQAFADADLFIHGSAPGIHMSRDFQTWKSLTGKPYGYYGVTMDYQSPYSVMVGNVAMSDLIRATLNAADFIYFRDTNSLHDAQARHLICPIMEFAPDAVFADRQRDPRKADAWMKGVGLEEGKFLCAIPRLRFAPYYKIKQRAPNDLDLRKDAYNAQYAEADLGKMREAITAWIRRTGQKVLVCPEMTFEVALSKEQIIDRLPDDVKPFAVWRDTYWMPDEAASVYAKATALLSMECHSPILAATSGVPSVYLTSPTETNKQQMWNDIGLGGWLLDLDHSTGASISAVLLAIHDDPAQARKKVQTAMTFVKERQQATMEVIKKIALAQRDKSPR